jgi:type VI secretion system secreted protein VgrG
VSMLVVTNITIEGKPIKQFRMFTLEQGIFAHHTFKLICPAEAIDGREGTLFNVSVNWIGASIHVEIMSAGADRQMQFAGVITQVSTEKHDGHAGDVIISGCSPTILLDNGPHCTSWEEMMLPHIVQDVLKHFPQNMLQPHIDISADETIMYTVQYRESAWKFLCRLAATYGEWLYYDGRQLKMGKSRGEAMELVYGRHISRFNVSLHARPVNFRLLAHDYLQQEVYEAEPQYGTDDGSQQDWVHHVIQKSRLIYNTVPRQWHNPFTASKKQLDDMVAVKANLQEANMIYCNGSSDVPCLQPGSYISVKGCNVYSNADEVFGDFMVFSVSHRCDGQGHYGNEFVAAPATVKVPPVPFFAAPHCEAQSAIVTDNYDVQGLGRIRVRFHWMKEHERSPWLRVTSPYAGQGKGFFALPEIGEEVMVAFEGDDPGKPYVTGCVYNGKASCDFSNAQNDIKIFQSRSGSKIEMDDRAGSVSISDKDGNCMELDGEGAILIDCVETLVLRCGDAIIELKKDGTITMNGRGITIMANGEVQVQGETIMLN